MAIKEETPNNLSQLLHRTVDNCVLCRHFEILSERAREMLSFRLTVVFFLSVL